MRFVKPHSFLIVFFAHFLFLLHSQAIPAYSVTAWDRTSEGYYFFAAIKPGQKTAHYPAYHFVLDDKGDVVYFKKFPLGISPGDFKLHQNGLLSYYHKDKFLLMDSTFTVVDSVFIKNGYKDDGHDLQLLPNGHYVLLGIEEETADLGAFGHFSKNNSRGSSAAIVRYGIVQEQDKNKNVVFEWHSKGHYDFAGIDSLYLNDPGKVNVPHINAVEADTDSSFLLSCRNFNEITKINRKTGAVTWRLGGNQNQFRFTNDTLRFYAQHDARKTPNGNLTLYDNGYAAPLHPSAGKEYRLNEKKRRATLAWSFTPNKSSYSTGIGNMERLKNGNTLIDYGLSSSSNTMFSVVSKKGKTVFEIEFRDSLRTYRAFNYPKLPWSLKRPGIHCVKAGGQWYLEAENGYTAYTWNDGSTGQRLAIKNNGRYFVSVPFGSGGNLCSATLTIEDKNNPEYAFKKNGPAKKK